MRQDKSIVSCRNQADPDKAKSAVWNLMRTDGGNKISEAARQEILDRNASEGIEPRNVQRQRGRQFSFTGRQQKWVRHGKNLFSLSGSKSAV